MKHDIHQRSQVEMHLTSSSTESLIVRNNFRAVKPRESFKLTDGSQKILNIPNAGGNSVWSEVLSCEILSTLFNAKLLRTEMELEYWPMGCKITDFSAEIFGEKIGVSVTRAMKFQGTFNEHDAEVLLTKKLGGVNESSRCIIPEHSWKRQILHIWATHEYIADVIYTKFNKLPNELKNDTLVMVTVVTDASWIF